MLIRQRQPLGSEDVWRLLVQHAEVHLEEPDQSGVVMVHHSHIQRDMDQHSEL